MNFSQRPSVYFRTARTPFCLESKHEMMKVKLLVVIVLINLGAYAQTVTNGTFSSAGSGWGCSPETNPVSVYGGSGSDRVAEVDMAANLCQTISGFGIGNVYNISFDCSRRTTCGPATQTMDLEIDGGALPAKSISRTGAFNFTVEEFDFTATATSHTIDFDGTSAGTCGLIVDNIEVRLVSLLPIELLSFSAMPLGSGSVRIEWVTSSETNNDFFTIERSVDTEEWQNVAEVDGAGNSNTMLDYSIVDQTPRMGVSYYRLKQTDFNGMFSISDIVEVRLEPVLDQKVTLFPNPTSDVISISGNEYEIGEISVYNGLGQDVSALAILKRNEMDKETVVLELSELTEGVYLVKTRNTATKVYKQ